MLPKSKLRVLYNLRLLQTECIVLVQQLDMHFTCFRVLYHTTNQLLTFALPLNMMINEKLTGTHFYSLFKYWFKILSIRHNFPTKDKCCFLLTTHNSVVLLNPSQNSTNTSHLCIHFSTSPKRLIFTMKTTLVLLFFLLFSLLSKLHLIQCLTLIERSSNLG